jgi:hypothetical protein
MRYSVLVSWVIAWVLLGSGCARRASGEDAGFEHDSGGGRDAQVGPDAPVPDAPLIECTIDADCGPGWRCVFGRCERTADPDAGMESDFDTAETDPYTGPVRGLLVGVVTDAGGAPLEGVRVSLTPAASETVTRSDGTYAVELDPGRYVVHFERDGHVGAHRRIEIVGWERVTISVALLPRGRVTSISAADEGVATGADGSSVTIPAGSLVDNMGRPISGSADVTVTPFDRVAILENAPGDFVGRETDGDETALVSYGMMEVEITTSTGMPAGIRSDSSMEIAIPAVSPDGTPVMPGDTVPLWYFDETTGMWVEDGTATAELRDGRVVFVGRVSRPGVWNCDAPWVSVCLRGRVVDCAGDPIAGADVRLTSIFLSTTTARTDGDGTYEVCGVVSHLPVLEARVRLGSTVLSAVTPMIPATSSPISAPDIVFDDLRYVGAAVELTRSVQRLWIGTDDFEMSWSGGYGLFWDVGASPLPRYVECNPSVDTLRLVPRESEEGGASSGVSRLDVGNPVRLRDGALEIPLYRYFETRPGAPRRFDSYRTMSGITVPPGPRALDISIPGARGALPATSRPMALQMPADIVVTSPSRGTLRTFDRASALPLRWEPPADGGSSVVHLIIAPPPGTGDMILVGTLADDGSFDVPPDMLAPFTGRALLTLGRTVQRTARTSSGPAVLLEGASRVTMDVEFR